MLKPKKIIETIKKFYHSENPEEAISYFLDFIRNDLNKEDQKGYRSIIEEVIELTTEQLNITPTKEAYVIRGMAYDEITHYDNSISDYTKALEIDPNYLTALNYRGWAYIQLEKYEQAIINLSKSLSLSSDDSWVYYYRGRGYYGLKDYNNAINDFTKSLELDPKNSNTYFSIADVYFDQNKYEEAITYWLKSFEFEAEVAPLFNIGLSYKILKEYEKALNYFSKAIEIDPDYEKAYLQRGDTYKELKLYDKAIENYRQVINSEINKSYDLELAKAKIKEIEKLKEDADYQTVSEIVDEIKKILRFEGNTLTHYTTLSTAKTLVMEKGIFRLSEAAFLNDTSEGKELYNYFTLDNEQRHSKKDAAELSIKKPFIGSFVPASKFDDLTLWRMYGKEEQVEAKGCSITLDTKELLNKLNEKTSISKNKSDVLKESNDDFALYHVAYKINNGDNLFIIPGRREQEDLLSDLILKLSVHIHLLRDKSEEKLNQWVRSKLTEIIYLFKTAEYQNEHEIRLVISGIGFKKFINFSRNPPGVYIELVDIIKLISKITLGPKVEKAEEWAAAFCYALEEEDHTAEILISHLPFK